MKMQKQVRVWDLPTRAFHWLLVLLFGAMWLSVELGFLQLHTRLGVAMLVLVFFRVLWGFAGSQSARFLDFVRGPASIRRYLAGQAQADVPLGHNPLGGLMVVAMLAALLLQLGLGLFAADADSYVFNGPLAHLIGDTAEKVSDWHGAWFNVLLLLVGMHVAAIVLYKRVKKVDLLTPMLTGHKTVAHEVAPLRFVAWWRAPLLLAIAAGVVLGGLSCV